MIRGNSNVITVCPRIFREVRIEGTAAHGTAADEDYFVPA